MLGHWHRYVTVYLVTREYGGPEEGGWYYNRRIPERTWGCGVPLPAWLTRIVARYLLGRYDAERYGDIYSVLGGQDVAVYEEHERHEHAVWGMTYE